MRKRNETRLFDAINDNKVMKMPMVECKYCHGKGWVVAYGRKLPCLDPIHELLADAPETATLKETAAVLMRRATPPEGGKDG